MRDTVRPGRRTGPVTIPGGLLNISTRFDEFVFEVTIRYRSALLEPDFERPNPEAVLRDDGQLLLARYMLGRTASKTSAERWDGQSVLTLALRNEPDSVRPHAADRRQVPVPGRSIAGA